MISSQRIKLKCDVKRAATHQRKRKMKLKYSIHCDVIAKCLIQLHLERLELSTTRLSYFALFSYNIQKSRTRAIKNQKLRDVIVKCSIQLHLGRLELSTTRLSYFALFSYNIQKSRARAIKNQKLYQT